MEESAVGGGRWAVRGGVKLLARAAPPARACLQRNARSSPYGSLDAVCESKWHSSPSGKRTIAQSNVWSQATQMNPWLRALETTRRCQCRVVEVQRSRLGRVCSGQRRRRGCPDAPRELLKQGGVLHARRCEAVAEEQDGKAPFPRGRVTDAGGAHLRSATEHAESSP